MANQFVKNTFGVESATKVALLGDSVPGAWSFSDRYDSSFYDLIQYYKQRGLNIDMKDYTITGGGYYNSRPSTYTIEGWLNAAPPTTLFTGRSIDAAIAWGATHIIVLFGSREATADNVNANPAGGNYFGEETIVLMEAYQALADTNGVDIVFTTTNASPTLLNYQDKFTALTAVIRSKCAELGMNYIDTYEIMTDSGTGLARPSEYIDNVHWTRGASSGHERWFEAAKVFFNDFFSLTTPVYDLISDTPCTDSNLVINELTNIAVTNELTGKFVFNEA